MFSKGRKQKWHLELKGLLTEGRTWPTLVSIIFIRNKYFRLAFRPNIGGVTAENPQKLGDLAIRLIFPIIGI